MPALKTPSSDALHDPLDRPALSTFRLAPGLPLAQPVQARQPGVTLASPARQVLTDLTLVRAATIQPGAGLRQAEQTMIFQGVRLLFVCEDASGAVLGLVTSGDLHGDRQMRLTHERDQHYDDLTVADVMTPLDALDAIDHDALRHATVGQLVATLARFGRSHMLVVQAADERHPRRLRGLISRSQIERQLGQPLEAALPVAETFAELEQALA
jgi:CBS domain-containing protein